MDKLTMKMISSLTLPLWLVLTSLALQSPLLADDLNEHSETLYVQVGQTRLMKIPNVTRVSIGDDTFLDVRVISEVSQLLLIGKQVGVTDLRVWTNDGKQKNYLVHMQMQSPQERLAQTQAMLEGIEGVEARVAGDQVIIEGQSITDEDYKKIELISRQLQVGNFVTAGGITMRGMIYLDVKVVEIRKSAINELGVRWAGAATGPVYNFLGDYATNSLYRGTTAPGGAATLPLDAGGGNPFFGISTSITSELNFLASKGEARFLAEPKLTCRSGGEAHFLAGGEVPIPISNADGALNVDFKQYGIILNMAPVSDPAGYISTTVEVEVSSIDPSVQVLGIPGFLTRKTDTEMNLREGQTMVISGLLSSNRSKDISKLPGLGNIPILGELFKSRSFLDNKTELVIFVTPQLIDPDHKTNQELLQHAADLEERSEKSLRFDIMD